MSTTLLTTPQAAALARRAPATVRSWAQRGLLVPTQRDDAGRPLYDINDVWRAERDARARDRTTKSAQAVANR